MNKGIVAALALTGSLLVGPAALAAPAEPSGNVPGSYTPQHAGHDHGKKPNKPRPKKPNKPNKSKRSHGHSDNGAHASGGYDSHRRHPRHW
jgi:hypothetical protein